MIKNIRICPICAIVSGTWITLLAARGFGAPIDIALIAMLMGGSVVGLAYTLGKRIHSGSEMIWKLMSIPIGFTAVYTALSGWWLAFVGTLVAAAMLGWFFFGRKKSKPASAETRELEEKMKQCC